MTEGAPKRVEAPPLRSTAPTGEPKPAPWLLPLATLVLAAIVLAVLVLGVGVELDAPTIGLALVCAAMIGALRGMWGIYAALARPSAEIYVAEADLGAAGATLTELREEKLRVLRAIKELEFDHAMGKLNDEDFKRIGDAYRLRAIEVMRLLDEDRGELHPLLREHLAALGRPDARAAGEVAPERPDDRATGEAALERSDARATGETKAGEPLAAAEEPPPTAGAEPAEEAQQS